MWIVGLIQGAANFLLLLGAGRLCGCRVVWWRYLLASLVSGLHSAACLLPWLGFLASPLWFAVSLVGTALLAWGMNRATLRRGAVFAVLRLALGGITLGIGGGAASVLLAAALLGILYLTGFRMGAPMGPYVPVEIARDGKRLHLTALHDTGNTLRDPVTGNPVLVIGAQAAQMLTGLTREQLRSPVESVGAIPGLRLVPYRAVGREDGLMLALKFQDVRIGKWKGSHLVAFAPEGLGDNGSYDALTGGAA